MKQKQLILGLLLSLTTAAGWAQGLSSDSKTIKSKAGAIEREYSRSMREDRTSREVSRGGAIVVEEGFRLPSSQAPIIESNTVVTPTYNTPPAKPPSYNSSEVGSSSGLSNSPVSSSSSFGAGSSAMTNSFNYPNNLQMREDRKMGVGISMGGALGLAGAQLEFNFEDADGVIAGFGTGPGYNSFQLAWKHSFEGRYLTPYTTAGYSRWYNSRGRGDDFLQSDVLDRVLTAEERRSGQFGTDFVNGSLGLQYNQLTGDLAGLSIFGEITGMYEMKRSNLIPNGSVGAIYFF